MIRLGFFLGFGLHNCANRLKSQRNVLYQSMQICREIYTVNPRISARGAYFILEGGGQLINYSQIVVRYDLSEGSCLSERTKYYNPLGGLGLRTRLVGIN